MFCVKSVKLIDKEIFHVGERAHHYNIARVRRQIGAGEGWGGGGGGGQNRARPSNE